MDITVKGLKRFRKEMVSAFKDTFRYAKQDDIYTQSVVDSIPTWGLQHFAPIIEWLYDNIDWPADHVAVFKAWYIDGITQNEILSRYSISKARMVKVKGVVTKKMLCQEYMRGALNLPKLTWFTTPHDAYMPIPVTNATNKCIFAICLVQSAGDIERAREKYHTEWDRWTEYELDDFYLPNFDAIDIENWKYTVYWAQALLAIMTANAKTRDELYEYIDYNDFDRLVSYHTIQGLPIYISFLKRNDIIPEDYLTSQNRYQKRIPCNMTDEQLDIIVELDCGNRWSDATIASTLGLPKTTIQRIMHLDAYRVANKRRNERLRKAPAEYNMLLKRYFALCIECRRIEMVLDQLKGDNKK